jgi:hypothetical protein
MKRFLISGSAAMFLVLAFFGLALAQQGQQAQPPAGWYCPWCGQGQGMMGPGMGYGGQGMGPGMMHRGMHGYGMQRGMQHGMQPGMHRGMRGGRGMHGDWCRGAPQYAPKQQYAPRQQQQVAPLAQEDAKQILEQYVARNPNVKVGSIQEQEDVFKAKIVTTEGENLVETVLVDKETGWVKPVY